MGQAGFSKLLCANRCPHRQEGRFQSRGSSTWHHAETKQKGQLVCGWSGNDLVTLCFEKKKKAQHPLKVNEPHIISCLPSAQWSCFYWVFFNPPRPPLLVYWKVKQMVSLHLLRRLSNSVTFGNGGGKQSERCQWHLCRLEECIPVWLCNSTWHFYYVWNW